MDIQLELIRFDKATKPAMRQMKTNSLPPTAELDLPDDIIRAVDGDNKKLPPWFHAFVQDIHTRGQIEPIQVARTSEGYTVIAGNKRLAAFRILEKEFPGEWDEILAVVRNLDKQTAIMAAAASNNQRHENAITDLRAIRLLQDTYPGISEKTMAKLLGINPQTLKRRLQLLNLDPVLMKAVEDGQISVGTAEAAAKLPDTLQGHLVAKVMSGQRVTADDAKAAQRVRVQTVVQAQAQRLFPVLPVQTKGEFLGFAFLVGDQLWPVVFQSDQKQQILDELSKTVADDAEIVEVKVYRSI